MLAHLKITLYEKCQSDTYERALVLLVLKDFLIISLVLSSLKVFHNNFSDVSSQETYGSLSKIKGVWREAKPVLLDQSLPEVVAKMMRKLEGRTPVVVILFVYLLPLLTPTIALFGPLAMRVQAESGQQVTSYPN